MNTQKLFKTKIENYGRMTKIYKELEYLKIGL